MPEHANTAFSSLVSEFDTVEQEASYNEWLRAKWSSSPRGFNPGIDYRRLSRTSKTGLDVCPGPIWLKVPPPAKR